MIALFRTLVFFIYFFIITLLFGSVMPLTRLFRLPRRWSYLLGITWMRAVIQALKYICGMRYHVKGLSNLAKYPNGIIFCKHQSTWETFFVPPLFYSVAIILKKELLPIPFFGWALNTMGVIAIDRKNKLSALTQILEQGKENLTKGRWVLVFPEGTRVAPGHVGKYHMSGAHLAAETGYPVLPIAHNAGRYWPRNTFIKRPGTIQVIIGPWIQTRGRTAKDILADAKQWIEAEMLKISM
ncbi:hypothetical protein AYO45_04285 [Gammaproteobacteria bacterium SCGC AG-212-F23]|nr:hypothetical protein AYO45_04285 [Gammaproteobacteria bacterium SCGC AG-212-F23]